MLLTDDHPIIRRRDENRAAWAKAQREAAAARAAKAAQRKSQASGSGEQTPVEHFNERHAIAELLGRYGYEQRGDSAHWRSPMQTTRGSYATRDYGGYWVSMSGSDAAAGVGAETRSGHRHGDAFDLFAFYEHGGDFSEAVHAYSLEAGLGGDGDWADVDWGEPEARRAGQGGEDDVADDGAGDEAGEGADGQAGEELAPGSGGDRAKANGHAKANGYYRANGHAKANGYDRANGHARANGRARNGAKRVIDFRKDSIWLSPDVEPVLDGAWLIRDWIPRRGLSVIYGASGAGKSHLAADMACHVARGEFWHGNPVEPGLVVYVALEGHGSLPNRVAALAQAFGAAPVWFIRARFSSSRWLATLTRW